MKQRCRALVIAIFALPWLCFTPAAAQPSPYEVNAILSLTGSAAALGADEQTSLQILEKAINDAGGIHGQQIHFAIADDQSSPQVALQLATGLVQKHVSVIIGPSVSATCRAVQPLINSSGTVLYCLSPQIQVTADGFLYTIGMSGQEIAAAMVHFLQAQGLRRIALLVTTDASGQGGESDTKEALKSGRFHDISLVDTEYVNPSDISATAQLTKIKTAKPDALLVFAPGTAFGTVLHAMHDLALDVPTVTTAANLSRTQTKEYDSFLPAKLYMQGYACVAGVAATDSSRRAQKFYFDSLKKGGLRPDVGYCLGWDPGMIVMDALRKYGPTITSAQLRDSIDSLHDWGGTMGSYDFRKASHRGLSESDVIILRWDKERDDFVTASALGGGPVKK
jgi:branched-chain amino acid transport system substrate-binding protein